MRSNDAVLIERCIANLLRLSWLGLRFACAAGGRAEGAKSLADDGRGGAGDAPEGDVMLAVACRPLDLRRVLEAERPRRKRDHVLDAADKLFDCAGQHMDAP